VAAKEEIADWEHVEREDGETPPEPPKDDEEKTVKAPKKNDYDLTELPSDDGRRRLRLTVTILGATSFSDVVLDVSERFVRIKCAPAQFKIKVPLAFAVDANQTKAKFARKTSLLTVTLVGDALQPQQ